MNRIHYYVKYTFILLTVVLAFLSLYEGTAVCQNAGRIMGFEDGLVRINWGTNDGLTVGIRLNVFQEVAVYHPVTRERFGSTESVIGTIELAECYDAYSLARIIQNTEQLEIGNLVRISFDSPDASSAFGAYEKGTILNITNRLVKFNMGRFDGVEKNLIFDVFRNLGASRHPVTGEMVEPENLYIGKVVVVNVEDDESLAQIITSERDIIAGDKVLLSAQQESDIELRPSDRQIPVQTAQTTTQQYETPVEQPQVSRELPEELHAPDNIIGSVTRVAGKELFFIWRGDYDFPAGRVFGVYRREELRHPETGQLIGNPLILLGRVNLVESIGEVARGTILSSDADILPRDLVGLTAGETISSGQVVTQEIAGDVYEAQRSDILEQARELTSEVQQIQGELSVLRGTMARLDRIDRELSAQKALTTSMNQTLEEIKMLLRGEGLAMQSGELIPSRANVERIEMPGDEPNVLRVRYTDDIDVKFELVDKSLMVYLDVDSLGDTMLQTEMIEREPEIQQPVLTDSAAAAQQDITGTGMIETVGDDSLAAESTPFYKNWIFLTILILTLLGVAGGLYFLLVMKKKSGGGGDADEEAGDEDGDDEEGEEDEFGGGDFGEMDEEEIESFDEEL